MPRAKRTAQGAPGQMVQAIQGQTYGEGKRQEALQRAMPTPNVQAEQQSSAQFSTPVQTGPQNTQSEEVTPVRQRASFQEITSALQGAGGLLRAPDDRPTVPVTDGLPTGPGRGPEALQRSTQLGNTLRRLAMQTNDPVFSELASKIGL